MTDDQDNGLLLTRITIERWITDDGDEVTANFEDSNGDMPSLVEIMGMLALTQDTAIRVSMGEGQDDDDA